MEQSEFGDDQPYIAARKAHRWKMLFIIAAVIVGVVVAGGIYFYILVRQNITNINGSDISNAITNADVDLAGAPFTGSPAAKVVIVEFSDFQCSYCKDAFSVVREIINYYGNRIKFEYRNFPIVESHPNAQKAAEAGLCAHAQDKFWAMHDKIFINQSDLSVLALKNYAKEINLDATKFNACLDQNTYKVAVQKDFSDGLNAGVSGTPTFFINGRIFPGVISFPDLQGAIDRLLAAYGQ
ncbi:MAG: DsbA family protein [Patescibacteria group bacterium]